MRVIGVCVVNPVGTPVFKSGRTAISKTLDEFFSKEGSYSRKIAVATDRDCHIGIERTTDSIKVHVMEENGTPLNSLTNPEVQGSRNFLQGEEENGEFWRIGEVINMIRFFLVRDDVSVQMLTRDYKITWRHGGNNIMIDVAAFR